ncbi:MAG: family 16 glycoside hydrolase [Candidatus Binataceae bacterium]
MSKVVEMTEKKCVSRPALWALGLASALAMAANVAFAAGNRMAAEVAAAADAPAPSGVGDSGGAKTWDFDHDRGYSTPQDWTVVAGDWGVVSDRVAPSEPNTLGLPGYGLPHTSQVKLWFDSFFNNNYLLAIPKDGAEYTDFSYEASFKPWGGAFGSYAGLAFRYTDPQNYYVLTAACPKDTLTLYHMSNGQLNPIKEVPATLERGRWYTLKVDASGGHFIAYLDGKQMFEANDSSIAKGRIGVWSQNDSKVSFDNIKLTPAAASGTSPSA